MAFVDARRANSRLLVDCWDQELRRRGVVFVAVLFTRDARQVQVTRNQVQAAQGVVRFDGVKPRV